MLWFLILGGSTILFGGSIYILNRKPYQEFQVTVSQMDMIGRANGWVTEVRAVQGEFSIVKFSVYPDLFWAKNNENLPMIGDLYKVELRDTSLWSYINSRKPRYYLVERVNPGY